MIPEDDITRDEHEYWERLVEAKENKIRACLPYTPEQVEKAVEESFLKHNQLVGGYDQSEAAITETDVEDFVIDVLSRLKGEQCSKT